MAGVGRKSGLKLGYGVFVCLFVMNRRRDKLVCLVYRHKISHMRHTSHLHQVDARAVKLQ